MLTEKQFIFKKALTYCNLGMIDYQSAWDLQHRLYDLRLKNQINDTLLLLEHPNTYTLGKAAEKENLVASDEFLLQNKFSIYNIDRGGDITYHGPGQVVGYIIMDLAKWEKDSHKYLRAIEDVIINVCYDYGIEACRIPKYTGVWFNDGKICAIGVKISRWISMHGFAFNVNTNLDLFNGIIPCGIRDKKVTSIEKEIGEKIDLEIVKKKIVKHFSSEFGYDEFEEIEKPQIFELTETERKD
jgi:lipoyl(octanoyl) transferase